MKNKPLAVQIWLVFAGITLLISFLVAVLFLINLRLFFNKQAYDTIEKVQLELMQTGNLAPDLAQEGPGNEVKHLILSANGKPEERPEIRLPVRLLREIRTAGASQGIDVERYMKIIDKERYYFVLRKGEAVGLPGKYLVSYIKGDGPNQLTWILFRRLMLITAGVLVFSWLPALWLAKYLSRPLVTMESHVRRIAEKDWHDPLPVERQDEIGRLGRSIELMRQQLIAKDEAQQSLLQHVSHELKTPVMVIRSYAQSLLDGIYPKGDLPGSVQVIEEEAERLEKRIRDLLYLTKLEYLATREPQLAEVDLLELAQEVIDRLRWRRPDLEMGVVGIPLTVWGEGEKLGVALENLLDNQMRFAQGAILLTLEQGMDSAGRPFGQLRLWNDGPPIEEGIREQLFERFQKGKKGEFGLGLAIVRRIADLHGARIRVENEAGGVAFYLEIPLAVPGVFEGPMDAG